MKLSQTSEAIDDLGALSLGTEEGFWMCGHTSVKVGRRSTVQVVVARGKLRAENNAADVT